MVGAIALALMFHRIVITGEPTALNGYGFVLLACGFIFLVSKGYSWLQDLYMPRPVIFWGEGGMLVGTLITIAAIVVDHLHERGLGNLIGLAIVLFPLLIFLIRVYMVFSDGRHIPSSRRSRMRVDASTERMAALRRKIRHWMS